MSYFPLRVMPKALKKETANEVDNSPLIYNAKDYNVHHRDLRAIEQTLLGNSEQGQAYGIIQLVSAVNDLISDIFNGSLLAQFSGTVRAGEQISLPSSVTRATASGEILAAATTITVDSTSGFPDSGTITKFNGLDVQEWCVGGGAPGGGGACLPGEYKFAEYGKFIGGDTQRTFQEVITYDGKTDTQFLNCTRAVNGTTAEDLEEGEQATIVLGNASLWLAPNVWVSDEDKAQNQFYVTYTPDLTVDAHVLEPGSVTVLKAPVDELVEVFWSMSLVSYYDIPSVDETFGAATTATPDQGFLAAAGIKLGRLRGDLANGRIDGHALIVMDSLALGGARSSMAFLGVARTFTLDDYGFDSVAESVGQSEVRFYRVSEANGVYGVAFSMMLGDITSEAEAAGLNLSSTAAQHLSIPVGISLGGNSFLVNALVKVLPGDEKRFDSA